MLQQNDTKYKHVCHLSRMEPMSYIIIIITIILEKINRQQPPNTNKVEKNKHYSATLQHCRK